MLLLCHIVFDSKTSFTAVLTIFRILVVNFEILHLNGAVTFYFHCSLILFHLFTMLC